MSMDANGSLALRTVSQCRVAVANARRSAWLDIVGCVTWRALRSCSRLRVCVANRPAGNLQSQPNGFACVSCTTASLQCDTQYRVRFAPADPSGTGTAQARESNAVLVAFISKVAGG
jgi:hypothetical protein